MSSNKESGEFVSIKVTQSEQKALREAAESVFGDASRISYGAMIRLMASDYKEDSN